MDCGLKSEIMFKKSQLSSTQVSHTIMFTSQLHNSHLKLSNVTVNIHLRSDKACIRHVVIRLTANLAVAMPNGKRRKIGGCCESFSLACKKYTSCPVFLVTNAPLFRVPIKT